VIRWSVTSIYLADRVRSPKSLSPRRPTRNERTAVRRRVERREVDDGRGHHLTTPPPARRPTGTLARALG